MKTIVKIVLICILYTSHVYAGTQIIIVCDESGCHPVVIIT